MESVRQLFVNLILFLLNYFVLCPAKIVRLYYAYCNLIEIHLYHKSLECLLRTTCFFKCSLLSVQMEYWLRPGLFQNMFSGQWRHTRKRQILPRRRCPPPIPSAWVLPSTSPSSTMKSWITQMRPVHWPRRWGSCGKRGMVLFGVLLGLCRTPLSFHPNQFFTTVTYRHRIQNHYCL